MVVQQEIHTRGIDEYEALLAIRRRTKPRVTTRLFWGDGFAILKDHDLCGRCVGASHDQVYGGSFVFQTQSVRTILDRFEVLRRRGPASVGIKIIFFHLSREGVIANLTFLEPAFI